MKTKIIEGTNGFNWGKFLVAKYDEQEWEYKSKIGDLPLLRGRGWAKDHIWVMDLETGEGFCTLPGGLPVADLQKHNIWVCPMFEPFLIWLYGQDLSDISKLPDTVDLVGESALAGYRRTGLDFSKVFSKRTAKALKKAGIDSFRQLCAMTEQEFKQRFAGYDTIQLEVTQVFQRENFCFAAVKPT